MERKTAPLQFKQLDESGSFVAYGAIFDHVDEGNDVIRRGAFAKSLSDARGQFPVLWAHEDLIGTTVEAKEDAHGLLVHGQLNMSVQKAKEVHALALQGAVKGMSIGYRPIPARTEFDAEGNRILREVKLFELSLTPFPMQPLAQIVSMKDGRDSEIIQMLRGVHHELQEFARGLFA